MLFTPNPHITRFTSNLSASFSTPSPSLVLASQAQTLQQQQQQQDQHSGAFVENLSLLWSRKHILSRPFAHPTGSPAWLDEVVARVQAVTPALRVIDAACGCRSTSALLQQLRHEILTPEAQQGLVRAVFAHFGTAPSPLDLCDRLSQLEWLPSLEPRLIDALCAAIDQHVRRSCQGVFDAELLDAMLSWMGQVALPWISPFVPARTTQNRVEFFVHETFGSLRIAELFDMVTGFPDSTPALIDLKACLARTHQHRELISQFGQALERRLLHPGANTNSILIVYVRTIKALRLLDPRGVLLEAVQDPVRLYLQSRPETVRCVVTALTNDGTNSELFAELGLDSTEVKPLDFENEEAISEHVVAGAEWEPDPVDADPASSSQARSTNDILAMLVRIYGSVQVFVNEYRALLADRLLKTPDLDVDAELKSLELLKLRFGEQALHVCGLMIKDVADSRRINANIRGLNAPLEAIIVSRISWPGLGGDAFAPHPIIRKAVRTYSKRFAELKKLRRIKWRHHVGVVELMVAVDGSESRAYSVAPVLANLLLHLADRPEWTLAQLAQATGLDEELTRKRMAFWVSEKVALEVRRGVYACASVLESGSSAQQLDLLVEEEDAVMAEAAGTSDEFAGPKDATHEQFVVHMLTNLGVLSLGSIHRNLQMFSPAMGEHAYERSEAELHAFMAILVNRGSVEQVEGGYQASGG